MAFCSKCSGTETDSYGLARCDKCLNLFCNKCSGVTASEHKGVALKKRSPNIIYLCNECSKSDDVRAPQSAFFCRLWESLKTIQEKVDNARVDDTGKGADCHEISNQYTDIKAHLDGIKIDINNIECKTNNYTNIINGLKSDGDTFSDKVDSALETILTRMDCKLRSVADNIKDTNVELVKIITDADYQNNAAQNPNVQETQRLYDQLFGMLSRTFCHRFERLEEEIQMLRGVDRPKSAPEPKITLPVRSDLSNIVKSSHNQGNQGRAGSGPVPTLPLLDRSGLRNRIANAANNQEAQKGLGSINNANHPDNNKGDLLQASKNSKNFVTSKIKPAQISPRALVFLGKVDKTITTSDIGDHLKAIFGTDEIFQIEELEVPNNEFKNFKVIGRVELEPELLKVDNWPDGLVVRKFGFFRATNGYRRGGARGNGHRKYRK